VNGRPILTADEMRAAEQRVIAAGTPAELLMERAGRGRGRRDPSLRRPDAGADPVRPRQ
jgi:hypothetical protein